MSLNMNYIIKLLIILNLIQMMDVIYAYVKKDFINLFHQDFLVIMRKIRNVQIVEKK